MDLRSVLITPAEIEHGCSLLDYQPFIITDDIQTGAAYSWVYGVNTRTNPPTLFKRQDYEADEWERISECNARLRRMYDDFIEVIASRYPGGTFLDVACNNGYFPVKAQLMGMGRTFGADGGLHFERSLAFLNSALGTNAQFIHALYDPRKHDGPIYGSYDVVSASAILCHVPDPLEFLSFLGSLANEAIFFFGQIIDADDLLVSYLKPHPALSPRGLELQFPFRFNDVTRISRGMIYHAFEEMGFGDIVEIPWRDEWLSPYFGHDQSEPRLEGETRDEVQSAWRLCAELSTGSKHAAILATRRPGQTRRTPERRPRSAAQSNVEAWGSGDLGNLEVRMASLQAAIETHSQRILSLEGTMETRTHRLTSVERTVEKLGRVSELLRGAFSLSGSRAVELLPILERTGAASGDNIPIRVAASAEPGHVLYGPYIRLDPGSYQLEISCRVSGHRDNTTRLMTIEIAAGDLSIAEMALAGQDLSAPIALPFSVTETTSALGPKIEVRISHHGHADLEISGVRLRHVPDHAGTSRGSRNGRLFR